MAQKNAQLCWIQKHTEEICNPLSGPPKKLKLTVYQMEEAWKDLNISFLNNNGHLWSKVNCAFSACTFQAHNASFHVIMDMCVCAYDEHEDKCCCIIMITIPVNRLIIRFQFGQPILSGERSRRPDTT
ncbi:hypothetical protein T4D_13592 [Trichinella pseudospiralis]|uniref:Uncharacterized protein n=1 Tax=Trichinella pseudospiralis TaxID=6337 RepID=A0A0V1FEK0_TRIPS|nr:hypothetical protein T4D_13592 [Trichinella pseudospiralis]